MIANNTVEIMFGLITNLRSDCHSKLYFYIYICDFYKLVSSYILMWIENLFKTNIA